MTDTTTPAPAPRGAASRRLTEWPGNELRFVPVAVGLIAPGLVFVLLTGEIDLSVAATSGVASVLRAATVIGSLSGRWITLIGVPSFVVALGAGLLLNGVLIIATVSNGLNLMRVANENRLIVTGLLLVIAVSIGRGIERLAGTR